MKLRTMVLSEQALSGAGRLLTPSGVPAIGPTDDFAYADTALDLGLGSPCSSGALLCSPRPKILARMERHLRTRELLVSLEGDAIVCIAPPQEPVDQKLKDVRAIRVKSGQAFIMDVGTWHWIPFPEGTTPVRYLVIFRSRTGVEDLYFHDFAAPYHIEA
ncbi:MAG TPA: ureidoglycolate lyase [Spirochaetia bacterium]|nr:ureidoglycolate lyase [Spirochaetia bacterium]